MFVEQLRKYWRKFIASIYCNFVLVACPTDGKAGGHTALCNTKKKTIRRLYKSKSYFIL